MTREPENLVIGPFIVREGALKLELYDPQQKKIKASWLAQGTNAKVGFVARTTGRYRVALTGQGVAPASFTWQTTITSPAERMAGRARIEPIVTYRSARIAQLDKDVAAKVPGALARFWQEAATGGGPIVEPLPRPASASATPGAADEDVLHRLVPDIGTGEMGHQRFYINIGLYELTPGDLPFDEIILAEGMTAANRRFRDILLAKGYEVTYRETGGDHSFLHWRATLAEALMGLLAPQTGQGQQR